MKLSLIIAALRQWAPGFHNRVFAARQFQPLAENQHMAVPAGFVMPWVDDPVADANGEPTGYRQALHDGFSVILVLDNTGADYDPAPTDLVHDLRAEVWSALLGWEPSQDYDEIVYRGGAVEYVDRARLYYRLNFSSRTEITVAETRHAHVLAALPPLETIHLAVDCADPADPNRAATGPDGRVEAGADITLPQD